ncbi:uncharacterized protein N7479_003140 [Penicillium vulpinum]|uniref:uncharacterized protein n=1 Tax=Penicillium vulpinum TaxID=29845 RepID=UPI0025492A6E|nr:uncharacterized protein N7479_003140 [Penicillium vulpinum]KAJ5963264.1 hypothetical protein N7479_003140 [Penicillium vulpinum]
MMDQINSAIVDDIYQIIGFPLRKTGLGWQDPTPELGVIAAGITTIANIHTHYASPAGSLSLSQLI